MSDLENKSLDRKKSRNLKRESKSKKWNVRIEKKNKKTKYESNNHVLKKVNNVKNMKTKILLLFNFFYICPRKDKLVFVLHWKTWEKFVAQGAIEYSLKCYKIYE